MSWIVLVISTKNLYTEVKFSSAVNAFPSMLALAQHFVAQHFERVGRLLDYPIFSNQMSEV